MDANVREGARNTLSSLFKGIGQSSESSGGGGGGLAPELSGLAGQLEEFVTMPIDVARIFLGMSVELADLVLQALEQAGFVIVKGVTPL
jgi:hypothetical protein